MDTSPSRLRFTSTQASRWRHLPSVRTLAAPNPPPGFEVQTGQTSRTPPHNVTDSPVLRSNWSNRRCRRVSDLPSLDAFESFVRVRHTGRLLDSPSSSPTWPTPSSSPCTLALPYTVWTAHGNARPSRVPRSRPTRIHPSLSWSLGMNLSLLQTYSRPPFTMNLSPDLHLAPSTAMPHPTLRLAWVKRLKLCCASQLRSTLPSS